MKKLLFAATMTLLPLAAAAQTGPQPVTLQPGLALHVVQFLQNGGTYAEGTSLAQQIIEAVQEPAKEAARVKAEQDKISAAVKAAEHPQVVEAPKK